MDPVSITDGALLLRPPRPSDAAALIAAVSDPEIVRWSTIPSPYTAEIARTRLEEEIPAGWASGEALAWYVSPADRPGELLAAVGVHAFVRGRANSADVGCWTAPAARGQGVTTRAMALLCSWAFDELGLARLQWSAYDGNDTSVRLAQRLGFVAEGVAHGRLPGRDGTLRDTWIASMLPGELRVPAGTGPVEVRPEPGAYADLPRPAAPPGPEPVEETDITAGTLHLRPWQLSDVPAVAAVLDDPDLARWNPIDDGDGDSGTSDETGDPEERALAFVRSAGDWTTGDHASFAVLDVVTSDLLGSLSLHRLRRDVGTAEVGFWTVPAARGQGVARRALETAARWGAGALGLRRIELIHAAPNEAACVVAERAGFAYELTMRSGYRYGDGVRHDEHLHAFVP